MGNAMLQPNRPNGRATRGWWASLSVLLFVILIVLLTVEQTSPPSPVPANAPASEFSSERAMEYMKILTQDVHSVGTPGHDTVRDDLIAEIKKLGYEPEVQSTTGYRQTDAFDVAATVQNVVVRVKGTEGSGKAVLLAAHYTSALHTVGADDAVPVAALLETMRNLKASGPLKHDVIFLFTDAKEPFPIGSTAFVAENPWAQDVGVFFNFDTRGSSGPVFMYETTDQNAGLIAEMAQALPSAFANSLLYSLYKLTYYQTDFTFFKDIPSSQGLNFAFANNSQNYHTQTDNLSNVDVRSLQQTGEYALSLARYFGNAPDLVHSGENAVFFNIGQWALVHYPASWVIPIAVVVAFTLLGVIVYGLLRKQLGFGRLLLGLLMFVVTLVAAIALALGATTLVGDLTDSFAMINHPDLFVVAFLTLTLAVMSTLYTLVVRKIGFLNMTAGALLAWLLIMGLMTVLVPVGSYLFTWPLLFAAIGLFYLLKTEEEHSVKKVLVLCVLAIPTLLLGGQFTYLLYMLETMAVPVIIVTLVALLGGLMIPQLDVLLASRRWSVPITSAVMAVVLFAIGVTIPAYDAQHPKWDTLFYGYNADTGKAYFGSRDTAADAFTANYIKNWDRTNFKPFFPSSLDAEKAYVQDTAPVITMPAPQLQVIDDKTTGDERDLHVKIIPSATLWDEMIMMTSNQPLQTGSINGKPMQNNDKISTRWELIYYGPSPTGIDIVLHLKPTQQVQFHVVDSLNGLPDALHIERPTGIVQSYFSDISYVAKTFTVDGK